MEYFGYKILSLDDEKLGSLYSGFYKPNGFKENQYLIVQGSNQKPVDYFCFKNNSFEKIKFPFIDTDFIGKIKPRNPQQYCALDLLKSSIPLKLITGKFGTGKTLLCIAAALEKVQHENFEKIIFVRNNIQVKDTDPLGALPGSENDKMLPYLMPFADHCGGIEGVRYLIDNKKLEVIPLGFMRGRSIQNSIIYSMESENLTKEHIQLLMGRVDSGSELWLDGDLKQRDKISFEKSRGLETMIEKLSGNPLFGYVHLEKSERSKVAALADLLD